MSETIGTLAQRQNDNSVCRSIWDIFGYFSKRISNILKQGCHFIKILRTDLGPELNWDSEESIFADRTIL